MIWHLHTLWNDHHVKFSNHLFPHTVTTTLLTIFLVLYITSLWLFNWRKITSLWLFCHINMNQPQVYMCPPSWTPLPVLSHPIPLGCPRAPALGALRHASNLHWSSVLHMVMYMFQCYSLKSSHPHLLPLSPKVCSLHLCLLLLSCM